MSGTVFYEKARNLSKQLITSGDEVVPTLLVVTNSKLFIADISNLDKDEWYENVQSLLRNHKAVSYVFMAESYQSKVSEDSPEFHKLLTGEITIHELPPDDRCDVLSVIEIANGNKILASSSAEISFDINGKRTLLDFDEHSSVHNKMNILPTNW